MLLKTAASNAASIKYPSVAIIGGGIGGLTAANALLHHGAKKKNLVGRVSVYEKASKFIPTAGAGFGFSPNGQICLSSIGINGYRDVCHPFDSMARITHDGTAIQQESNVLQQLRERHGFGIAGCLRADIINLLVDNLVEKQQQQVPVLQYSQALTRITPQHDKVQLEFESGDQDVVDLVIGADGIDSTIAKQMKIDDENPPIYSGANIFYGKIPNPDRFEYLNDHPIFRKGSVVNGPGTGEFIAFHVGSGDQTTFIWANTYASPSGLPPKREEWSNQGNAQELEASILRKYPNCHPIHEFASMTKNEDLLHFGMYYRHHKKTWTHDRVVLLGDACHATLPYIGQGANQAIEDAIVLAECLYRHDNYTQAYQEYYDKRFPRTKRIVQFSGLMNKLYHTENWFLEKALDLLLSSAIKGGAIFRQLEKEIVEECPVKDYQQHTPT